MRELNLSHKRIDGGFFIIKDVPINQIQWKTDTGKEEYFVGTYKNSGSPIRDSLLELLRSAKQNIFIASFVLGDQEVIDAIVAAADRLRGGVYVITALDDRSLRKGLEEYDQDESIDSPERKKNFERLTSRGVYVRGHESCHAKFAIVDDSVALVGSANFVKNGFEWTGEANIVIRSASEVTRIKQLFTQLWFEGCTYEIPPGVTYKVAKRGHRKSPMNLPAQQLSPGSIVWTNGPESTSLVECIKEIINLSEKSLFLSSYSIVGMKSHPELLYNDIVSAVQRGVEVSLFVRQRNAWPSQCDDLNYLYEKGVKIYADTRNHAKVAIADKREAVLFSANFDAKHGLNSGVEVGYRLLDPMEIEQLVAYVDHAIKYVDTQYLNNPMLSQLDGRLAARWCSAWRLNNMIKIGGFSSELSDLNNDETIPPVLYEEARNGTIHIWLGSHEFVGKEIDGSFHGVLTNNTSSTHSSEKLKSWLQSVRGPSNPEIVHRGFFTGTILAV